MQEENARLRALLAEMKADQDDIKQMLKQALLAQKVDAASPRAVQASNKLIESALLSGQGRDAEAGAKADEAAALHASAGAHNNLGNLLKDVKKDYAGAEQEYRTAVLLDRELADAHYNLGRLLQNVKDYDGAEQAYRMAIRLDPEDKMAHNNLGTLLEDAYERSS